MGAQARAGGPPADLDALMVGRLGIVSGRVRAWAQALGCRPADVRRAVLRGEVRALCFAERPEVPRYETFLTLLPGEAARLRERLDAA